MKRFFFYLLSFTWGLPMTLIGLVVAAALLIIGKRPTIYGYCIKFSVGKGWGGISLGIVFITSADASERTSKHEHGHALQNCLWGFLMLFVIGIPSFTRAQYRKIRYHKRGLQPPTKYDSIWFEGQATRWGTSFIDNLMKKGD